MGQRDNTVPSDYAQQVRETLEHPLMLRLPDEVLAHALAQAHAQGLKASAIAVRLVYEHGWAQACRLLEEDGEATVLTEFALVARLDEALALSQREHLDLSDLMPNLKDLVGQPCFSDEFRDAIATLATWHSVTDQRWPQNQEAFRTVSPA